MLFWTPLLTCRCTQHNANGVAIEVTWSANLLLKCSNAWLIMYRIKRRNIIILSKIAPYNFPCPTLPCRRLLFVESEAWNLSPLILIYKQKCYFISSVCARKNGSGRNMDGRQIMFAFKRKNLRLCISRTFAMPN